MEKIILLIGVSLPAGKGSDIIDHKIGIDYLKHKNQSLIFH